MINLSRGGGEGGVVLHADECGTSPNELTSRIDKCARSVSWTEALKSSLSSFDRLEIMIKQA